MFKDLIYVQWYPYRNRSGFYIENPSEDALEKFYENVNASDPYHNSFVLKLGRDETYSSLDMRTIDDYIQHDILPFLFKESLRVSWKYNEIVNRNDGVV